MTDDEHRSSRLFSEVYEQLRNAARQRLRAERSGHTLQATALVHEAYLKLQGERNRPWAGKAHFYAAAAQAMRQVLLDHAKARARAKRGGNNKRVALDVASLSTDVDPLEILSLDEAICRLAEQDQQVAEVVRLRFFAGLEISEVAGVLDISPATVKRRWDYARAWLFRELGGAKKGPDN